MIEAISANVAFSNPPSAAVTTAPLAQAPIAPAGDSSAADSFRDALSRVHDEIAKFDFGGPKAPAATADPVAMQANAILPSPWNGAAPTGASLNPMPAGATSEANAVVRQSFDHAIAVTLISQVVGGLSQTTSTLIRQQ